MAFPPLNLVNELGLISQTDRIIKGIDNFKNNPIAAIPRGEATPVRKFQYSKEFANDW